jgi:hypothetical protein
MPIRKTGRSRADAILMGDCDCASVFEHIENWEPFGSAAASGENGFDNVPERSGTYVLRVRKVGETDVDRIRQAFLDSKFMVHLKLSDEGSEELFKSAGMGTGWGRSDSTYWTERLDRLKNLEIKNEILACPIIYIGKSNNLWRRMVELANGGHTANSPVWALLYSGWELELGFAVGRKKAETEEEARLKSEYAGIHDGALPPLVQR